MTNTAPTASGAASAARHGLADPGRAPSRTEQMAAAIAVAAEQQGRCDNYHLLGAGFTPDEIALHSERARALFARRHPALAQRLREG
jgi:hypothetical protein